jgi:hypothetical protein
MTAQDLTALADKLDELAMKATTRGPWKVTNGGLGIEGQPDATSDFDPVVIGGCKGGKGLIDFPSYGIYSTPGRKEGEANAAMIVALRNALPQITTALREAARLREAEKITLMLASFKDPRTVSCPDEELELFAKIIEDAKAIHGDLHEDEEPGHGA